MKLSILLKKIISNFYFKSGLFRYKINKYAADGYFCILMYHRVIPPAKEIQAGMYVKPDTFNKHIKLLQEYFEIISLEKLVYLKNQKSIHRRSKPFCVLSFDDGWRDFYNFALPILKKHKAPAIVFLPTEFIDSNKKFWTDEYAFLLSNRQTTIPKKISNLELLSIVEHVDNLHGSFDIKLESGIEYLKKFPLKQIEVVLHSLSEIWNIDLSYIKREFLNIAEIEEIKSTGLVSFGSHTINHQILTTISDAEVKKELIDSRNELLEINAIDNSFVSFCYPNGNFTKEIADMVRTCGYDLAVTTINGWNHADADAFTLKRIGIHEDMTSTKTLFASRIAGLI